MRIMMTAALATLVALAGCTGGAGTTVEVGDDYFEVEGEPGSNNGQTTAGVGDTFTFEVTGSRPHTVTIHRPPDPATTYLIDRTVSDGDSVSFTFDEAGTYHVYCRFHGDFTSGMRLTVTVS